MKPILPASSTSKYIPYSKKMDLKKKHPSCRHMLKNWYNIILSEMSTVQKLNFKSTFDEDSPNVECYCIQPPLDDTIVFCAMCGSGQHSQCVHFEPKPFQEITYFCSNCWTTNDKFQCKATLIVVPQSILSQWIDEVIF